MANGMLLLMVMLSMVWTQTARAEEPLQVPNAGFEVMSAGHDVPEGWQIGIGGGAKATVEPDGRVFHSGGRSLRITNQSPMKAFVYVLVSSSPIAVEPRTTYIARAWFKGSGVSGCYFGVRFEGEGERRQQLPSGDFDWRQVSCRFTTPENCRSISLRFASDDVTASLWADDVSVEIAPEQLANRKERRYPKHFPGVFPRTPGAVARHLTVFDVSGRSDDTAMAVAALQGIINRRRPRLYVINPTNPPMQDLVWLRYMQEKGYTGSEERIDDLNTLIARYRDEITGVILIDPDLPGSVHAAFMLAGLQNALPVSPEMAARLGLPVVMDLRGRWKRNVDAYRYVYEHYWDRMNHHILAWEYPLSAYKGARDYMVEFNIFCFWVSSHSDGEKGADPEAEEVFVNELLANTPANIPVMGWPAYGERKGITEYAGVRWLSEYGKFVPGSEFCSNLSVHTAIRPDGKIFKQKSRQQPARVRLQNDRTYVALNILDSGDALWYWQLHQRKIWADPVRGSLPIGWCMNPTLYDTLPLVLQWYYEHATPNDTFFAAVSGLGYMNTQVYGSLFRAEDRERIWREYVRLTGQYCRKIDMDGIALYNGAWSEPTPPTPETFRRFTRGVRGLNYILADLGRHNAVQPDRACYLLDGVAVFHTLTRFEVWTSSTEVLQRDMEAANAWLLEEIKANTPSRRPGFLSAMAISWYYYPAGLEDLKEKLPSRYVVVSPAEIARLFRESLRAETAPGADDR